MTEATLTPRQPVAFMNGGQRFGLYGFRMEVKPAG